MKASVSYKEVLEGMQINVSRIQELTEKRMKDALNKIGIAVKSAVAMTVPVSDKESYWYKGNKRENVHIADDIEYKIKKAKRTKELYVTISGGKKTWAKWHVANDGHVAQNGKFIQGNYFADKAVVKAENEIDDIVDSFLQEVVRD